MQVWITRTDTSAEKSAKAVALAGFTPLLAPLLKLVASSVEHAAPDDDCALAFTSQNGVRAFAALTDRREWPIFAVGDATAKLAKDYGFSDVKSAGGDVEALAELIIGSGFDIIVHLSGVHVAGDLVGALNGAGLKATRTIIYSTEAVSALPENVDLALRAGTPLAVMLYSPKAAHIFRRLTTGYDLRALTCVSISSNVDGVLDGLELGARYIAKTPDEPAMIAMLEVPRPKA